MNKKYIKKYMKYLEEKLNTYENIYTKLEEYIKFFGKTYPNGRQFLVPYKCVDDIIKILDTNFSHNDFIDI